MAIRLAMPRLFHLPYSDAFLTLATILSAKTIGVTMQTYWNESSQQATVSTIRYTLSDRSIHEHDRSTIDVYPMVEQE